MNKFLNKGICLFLALIIIASCSEDNITLQDNESVQKIEERKATSPEIKTLVTYLNDYSLEISEITSGADLTNLNMDAIKVVKENTSNNESILIPINAQYFFSVTKIGNKFGNPLILNFESNDVFTYTFLKSNSKFMVNMVSQEFQAEYGLAERGCGQATMDCLSDAYTNHGWVSVWAFVQTAFIPATAAALAAACAAINCLQ